MMIHKAYDIMSNINNIVSGYEENVDETEIDRLKVKSYI